jgi:hypothetical protein
MLEIVAHIDDYGQIFGGQALRQTVSELGAPDASSQGNDFDLCRWHTDG